MKTNKLIRYRLSVSRTFPATHPRKGEPTWFVEGVKNAIKIHTIRGNYEAWEKKFEKINKGEAVLELYYWDGKPYGKGVNQVTICQLGKEDGIGIQKIKFVTRCTGQIELRDEIHLVSDVTLCKNDGLSLEDFKAWFKGADLSKPMAIIHFTKFRY